MERKFRAEYPVEFLTDILARHWAGEGSRRHQNQTGGRGDGYRFGNPRIARGAVPVTCFLIRADCLDENEAILQVRWD